MKIDYGPGINKTSISIVAEIVSEKGCKTTVSSNGLPDMVSVYVDGEEEIFFDTGDATGWALERCKPKPKGKHVTLRYGSGFSPSKAESIARIIESEGCPVHLSSDGPFDDVIDVEIGEDWETFETAGSAAGYALTVCKE